ncbi:hypothetical protein CEXT_8621 [Caerostris extrusa]|uniref:Uncharacterized protein n=1 Tax=Caerostris extrusa TaxID=172846 RepID=A0AAV4UWC2_CAEEX|nr:hypothetical protein CEXT_8621 [Caerostris extrusa]
MCFLGFEKSIRRILAFVGERVVEKRITSISCSFRPNCSSVAYRNRVRPNMAAINATFLDNRNPSVAIDTGREKKKKRHFPKCGSKRGTFITTN